MVRVDMGLMGSGKTKQLITAVNELSKAAKGSVIVIERGEKLKNDIPARVARLINTLDYSVCSYQVLRGFVTGLYAGNYDITHVFLDSLFKIAKNNDMDECEKFLEWADEFGKKNSVEFYITVSADADTATAGVKKFIA